MSREFHYPSADFPPFPGIAISAPDDWSPAWVPGAVVAVRQDTPPERFAPNVLVTVARYTSDYSIEDGLSSLREDLSRHPGAEVTDPIAVAFGEDDYALVNVAYDDAVAGTLVQVHAYTSVAVGSTHKDVVQVIGTCSAATRDVDYPLLQQVMNAVRLRPLASVEE